MADVQMADAPQADKPADQVGIKGDKAPPSLSLRRRFQPASPIDNNWIFLLECETSNLFKKITEILLLQMSEINMEISDTGLHIVGMESSQIALVDFSVTKKNFSMFTAVAVLCKMKTLYYQ